MSQFNEHGPVPDFLDLIRLSDTVNYYNLTCMVHRATPQHPGSSVPVSSYGSQVLSLDCIIAARKSLQAHLECASRYKGKNEELWAGYIHWAILNAPFTPFMLLFCHVISTYDLSDLQLLADFADSLHTQPENADKPNYNGAERMYGLCFVFHRVAKLYVEAKAREAEFQNQNAQRRSQQQSLSDIHNMGNGLDMKNLANGDSMNSSNFYHWQADEFNPYFNALGFMPGIEYTGESTAPGMAVPSSIAPQNQIWTSDGIDYTQTATAGLQDWFSGNQNIMGLLEQDLDFGPWQ